MPSERSTRGLATSTIYQLFFYCATEMWLIMKVTEKNLEVTHHTWREKDIKLTHFMEMHDL